MQPFHCVDMWRALVPFRHLYSVFEGSSSHLSETGQWRREDFVRSFKKKNLFLAGTKKYRYTDWKKKKKGRSYHCCCVFSAVFQTALFLVLVARLNMRPATYQTSTLILWCYCGVFLLSRLTFCWLAILLTSTSLCVPTAGTYWLPYISFTNNYTAGGSACNSQGERFF